MAYALGSKVIIGGETIIDLTQDDVLASDVASGKKFHLKDGTPATGTNTFDADTSDGTAVAAEILSGKTAYVNGQKKTGTMPNRGAQSLQITDKSTPVAIPQGYHDGSGTAAIAAAEAAKLIPGNVREGVTVLGVTGTMSGSESVVAVAANVTPTLSAQTIVPSDIDEDANSISQINVAPIPVVITDNVAGGKTYTIG